MAKFELKDPLSWFGGDKTSDKNQVSTEIETDKIKIVYSQPRKKIEGAELDELIKSISMHGLLEPILVKQNGDFYNLICGERRLTACRQLGLKTIAANIRNDIKDEDIFAVQIVENLHRKDLEPMELASAYKQLLDKYRSLKDVARFVGKSKSHVFDTLSILSIDKRLRGKVTKKNVRKAIEVVRVKDDNMKSELIKDFDNLRIKDIQNKKNKIPQTDALEESIFKFNANGRLNLSVSYLKRFTRIDLKIPASVNPEKIIKQILNIKED